ncbi:hypothetical protein ACFL6Y_09955 [Elusimicrobiota bacterium]
MPSQNVAQNYEISSQVNGIIFILIISSTVYLLPAGICCETIPFGGKSTALGGSLVSSKDAGVYGIYHNPSLLAISPYAEFALDYVSYLEVLDDDDEDESKRRQSFFGLLLPFWKIPGPPRAFGLAFMQRNTGKYFREEAFFFSYASQYTRRLADGKLYWGETLKGRWRRFGDSANKGSGLDLLNRASGTGTQVSVINGRTPTAFDLDFGITWRRGGKNLIALQVSDLFESSLQKDSHFERFRRKLNFGTTFKLAKRTLFHGGANWERKTGGVFPETMRLGIEQNFFNPSAGFLSVLGAVSMQDDGNRDYSFGLGWESDVLRTEIAAKWPSPVRDNSSFILHWTMGLKFGYHPVREKETSLYFEERALRMKAEKDLDLALKNIEELRLANLKTHDIEEIPDQTFEPLPGITSDDVAHMIDKRQEKLRAEKEKTPKKKAPKKKITIDPFLRDWRSYVKRKESGARSKQLFELLRGMTNHYGKRTRLVEEWKRLEELEKKMRDEYNRTWESYKKILLAGADRQILLSMLNRIIELFEDTQVDLRSVHKEKERLRWLQ